MKQIPQFPPGYMIAKSGVVFRPNGKPKKPEPNHEGYLRVRAHGYPWRRVHRLVLEAFVGPCPPGMQARHLDGDRLNNDLSNLSWGTPAENAADQIGHGTNVFHKRRHLTDEQVIEIRRFKADNPGRHFTRRFASKFGVSRCVVKSAGRSTGGNYRYVTVTPTLAQPVVEA